ncbi:MAG: hypothetical protein RL093_113 [Pseudomonadota bacterium]|jgi:hypothetical protein
MSNTFLRLAVLFALVGVSLGYWMGVTQQFGLSPVHAHINLLGWASMFLYGLFYRAFPRAGEGLLPKLHLGLAAVGLPVMMLGLTIKLAPIPSLLALEAPMLMGGPTLILLGMVVFAFIVFKATDAKAAVI